MLVAWVLHVAAKRSAVSGRSGVLQCCCAVKKGDRVAQLILERIATPEVVEVEELDDTVRGAGGYGSTGVAAS